MPHLFRPSLVGLINLLFTVFAILFIDKLGRKPLLVFGVAGIAICMFLLSYGFHSATYTLNNADLAAMEQVDVAEKLQSIAEVTYTSDVAFKAALVEQLG
jgi:SP family arabinose:H+ symporter-like MFS transporter